MMKLIHPPLRALRALRALQGLLLALACGLLLTLGCLPAARAACSAGGCVQAGPRLASVNSVNGALLNALLGNLTGSTLTLSVLDWNSLATGDVSLLKTVNALQATLGASTPTTALATNATIGQVIAAAATAATSDNNTTLALALNNLNAPLALVGGGIKLGDLLSVSNGLGDTTVNALDLVSGVVQLYNTKNVASTPSAVGITGAALGLPGLINTVSLQAQVVEPPVYVCGPVGSTFHSAAIRLKLNIDLVDISLDTSTLLALLGVSTATVKIADLRLYVEVARGDGSLTAVNAVSNTLSVQAKPGVAALYLGTIADNLFFNRTRAINVATDLSPAVIGSVKINALTLAALSAQASAVGQAASTSSLNFTGPYPQTLTAYTQTGFVSTLLNSMLLSLQLTTTPNFGLLDVVVQPVLWLLVQSGLSTTLNTILGSVVDPLLNLLGVRLGEMDVQASGTYLGCAVSGSVYADANHSSTLDAGEAGTGVALYAKLMSSSQPAGPALYTAMVDTSTGSYSFSNVGVGSYTLVVCTTAAAANVAPVVPSGWIATETPSFSRALTLSADTANLRFGLYRGSRISGTVFKDIGNGAGTANNGVRDGAEAGIVGTTLTVTDSSGNTVYGRTTSGDQGSYTLWIPYTAAGAVKIVEQNPADTVSVGGTAGNTGGSYVLATDTVSFTAVSGGDYTGVNFADVPANRFDTDGQQMMQPGKVAFYAHAYVAGSAGQLSFLTSAPSTAGWSSLLYEDLNCNGQLDSGEAPISAARTMAAGQKLCIVMKVVSPAGAPYGTQYALVVTARLSYTNNTLVADQTRQDLSLIEEGTDGVLRLTKAVDKVTAAKGDLITYTITYRNVGNMALSGMKITDQTPAYTVLDSASCGTPPDPGLSCQVTLSPAVNAAGRVEWTFTGSVGSGWTGTVTLRVLLQ